MFSFRVPFQKYVPYKQLRADIEKYILSNGASQYSLTEPYPSANRQHAELTTKDFCKLCSTLALETYVTGSHDFLQWNIVMSRELMY